MKRAWIVLATCAVLGGGLRADELHLKDGSVLNGTIVGFDENSFKVKTNYGYAIVRRDQVVSIEVRDPDADPAAAKKPDPNAKPPSPAASAPPASAPATSAPAPTGSTFPSANGAPVTPPAPRRPAATISPASATTTSAPPPTNSSAPAKSQPNSQLPAQSGYNAPTRTVSAFEPSTEKPKAPANSSSSAPISAPTIANASDSHAPSTAYGAESSPPPASIKPTKTMMEPPTKKSAPGAGAAAKPPAIAATGPAAAPASASAAALPTIPKPKPPEPIHESIDGNTYKNDTYGFEMFRPPGWYIIEDARTTLPGAIAALGTSDQTTYLLIGASPSAGTLLEDLKASDVKLKELVENYRPLGDQTTTVGGLPALQRKFRGAVDGKDWSGTVVLIERGKQLYTIFGMTYAGTDLVQIQENVIHRTITSLKFTK
jgi:hypothetical protein